MRIVSCCLIVNVHHCHLNDSNNGHIFVFGVSWANEQILNTGNTELPKMYLFYYTFSKYQIKKVSSGISKLFTFSVTMHVTLYNVYPDTQVQLFVCRNMYFVIYRTCIVNRKWTMNSFSNNKTVIPTKGTKHTRSYSE